MARDPRLRTICVMVDLSDDDPVPRPVRSEMILESLQAFTPTIEILEPGIHLVPALGPARYHGGEESLAHRMRRSVMDVVASTDRVGPTVVVTVAGGPVVAVLLARAVMASRGGGIGGGIGQGVGAGSVLVSAEGADAGHLAGLSIDHVADLLDPGVVELFIRLGLSTVGAFAGLPIGDVGARFGPEVAEVHRILNGVERRPSRPEIPGEDMGSTELLEPPLETVDQVAFVARSMAHEVVERLSSRSVGADTVLISMGTDTGEQVERLWRLDRGLSVPVITQRVRWQMEGWLRSGRYRSRGGAGGPRGVDGPVGTEEVSDVGAVSSIRIEPGEIRPYRGVQMGFWGGTDDHDRLVMGGLDRLRGLFGVAAVRVPRSHGGRSPRQSHRMADADDDSRRGALLPPGRDPSAGRGSSVVRGSSAGQGSSAGRTSSGGSMGVGPWPGSIPEPFPARVWADPVPADVVDAEGEKVGVSGRGVISSTPEMLSVDGGPWWRIVRWAGPWCVDERWWDPVGHRRKARIQVLAEPAGSGVIPMNPVTVPRGSAVAPERSVVPIGSGRPRRRSARSGPRQGNGSDPDPTITQAHLLTLEAGEWWVEATYD